MVNSLFELYVFDVWLWQSIFFRPILHENYNLMIDAGHIENKHPIDYILNQRIIPVDEDRYYYIGNLVITNYDHDHYSWLPYLIEKVKIKHTNLIKSIDSTLLDNHKPEKTEALQCLVDIKNTYIYDAPSRNPPYQIFTKYLYPWETWNWDFNNLSQITFIEYMDFTICIPWDLEKPWWELMLKYPEVTSRLKNTQIFFASHHWRENGYVKEIFDHCNPNLIIISDKEIVHSTQEKSSDVYRKHVIWDGITFDTQTNRKVVSTRSDGSFCFIGWEWLEYLIKKIDF